MINKKLFSLLENIKSVDTLTDVCISPFSLIAVVEECDINQLVCCGHLLGCTVVCTPSVRTKYISVLFQL